MKNQLIIGLAIGFGLCYLWKKKNKKPCNCHNEELEEVEEIEVKEDPKKKELTETDNPKTCEEAVKKIMMTMRFGTPESREQFFRNELKKCQNTR